MYQPVIGLEIHVELRTKSKMFCSCPNNSDEKQANFNICPVCMGHPGTLPVINKEALRKVIKAGVALNCRIPEFSKFDRKNYFYPDLPKGYQISQYDKPLCEKGFLDIGEDKRINITRVHLEEDTGRLIHEKDGSLVDYNRAGVPLMELVTEPEISSAKEARRFAEELQLVLRYIDISDADMEKGQMRIEANISVKLEKDKKLGTKVEIKNLNSFRVVEQAIDYEIRRQKDALETKNEIIQETRGWNEAKSETFSQRAKEEAHDYRYFPEPDLPLLRNTEEFVEGIKKELPELPWEKRKRYASEYGLDESAIEVFVQNIDLGDYFERIIKELRPEDSHPILKLAKITANYLITDLQGVLAGRSVADSSFLVKPEDFADFVKMVYDGSISSKIAKIVLSEMASSGSSAAKIIQDKNLIQISNVGEIEAIVNDVIEKNSKALEDFKKGKENAFQYLVGQSMAASRGRANPDLLKEILRKELTSR